MDILQNESEVARLRAAIEAEALAANRGLSGLASTARHAAITARMERIGRYHESLAALIGSQEATQMVCGLLEQHTP